MTGNGSDPELGSEDSRLVSLEERLDRAEAAEAKRTAGAASPESDANYRLGNRVLAELIGGLAGGADQVDLGQRGGCFGAGQGARRD